MRVYAIDLDGELHDVRTMREAMPLTMTPSSARIADGL